MYTYVVLGWWHVVMATPSVVNDRVSVVMCMLSLVRATVLCLIQYYTRQEDLYLCLSVLGGNM